MWRQVSTWSHRKWCHVIPIDDAIKHEESRGCVCGPKPDRRVSDDGEPFTLWVHAPLDGRDE